MRFLPVIIIFFVMLASAVSGQTIEVTPKSKNVAVDVSEYETSHYIEIKNNGNKTIRLEWTKIIKHKTDDWNISICDTTKCYRYDIDNSGGVGCLIDPGTILEYKIIAYPNEVPGEALVDLKVFELGDESNSATIEVHFNGLISTNDPGFSSVKIFPNPVKDILSFENISSSDIGGITIYNAMGVLVKQFQPESLSSNRYNTDGLNDGLYFVKISSKDNRASSIKKFIKIEN